MNLVVELSSDFFEKFPSIRTVEVTGAADPDQLAWFLKSTRNLRRLILSSSLGQQFMNDLPNINDRLTDLRITGSHPNAVTNFDFILQFRLLRSFVTDLQVEGHLDLAGKLFEQFASFHKFESKEPWNESIAIERDRSIEDRFELSFHVTKYGLRMISSCRPKRKWNNLVELCKKRKATFGPATRSSKRIPARLIISFG